MSQNLSSAAIVIGALIVNLYVSIKVLLMARKLILTNKKVQCLCDYTVDID